MVGMADLAILTVFAFVSWYFFPFLVVIACFFLMILNVFLFFEFFKHFSANIAINNFLLVLIVGMFNISSDSLYVCFLLSIKFTATFWTHSIFFSFFFVRLEPQTTQHNSWLAEL